MYWHDDYDASSDSDALFINLIIIVIAAIIVMLMLL